MSYNVSRLDVASGIAEFTMTREAKRNPMVPDLMADLTRLVDEVAKRTDIASLIITGGPGAFCAGGDMTTLKKGFSEPAEARTHMREANVWLERLYRLEKPVIMAVDGAAYGGGLSLALAGDFIMASPRASFSAVFGRIGLIPDLGCMYTLPRLVGLQHAKDMIYTARRVGAEEGLTMGLVHSIHPSERLMDAARAFAHRLTVASGTAFGVAKTVLNESLHSNFTTIEKLEISGQPLCLKSAYHAAAVERFVNKQPALFDWDRSATETPAE